MLQTKQISNVLNPNFKKLQVYVIPYVGNLNTNNLWYQTILNESRCIPDMSHLILCQRAKTVTAVITHTQIQFCFQCNNMNSKYTCPLAQPGLRYSVQGCRYAILNKSSQCRRLTRCKWLGRCFKRGLLSSRAWHDELTQFQ